MPRSPLYKYTPGQASNTELAATFVAREGLLEQIVQRTHQWLGGEAPEHTLLLGARGMGKTHLLRLLAHRLEATARLGIALFPEESYAVGTASDLVQDACARLQGGHLERTPGQMLGAAALDQLRLLHQRDGRHFLLLIDSFDLLLDQLRESDEAQLHQLLTTEDYLCVVAAAGEAPLAVTDAARPLFQIFRLETLRPLDAAQAEVLLRKRAEWAGEVDLLHDWPRLSPRVRAIADLAGGNPRLLLMLYQSLEVGELPSVVEAFRALLDELTPYFKHLVEHRAPQQRKLLALAALHDRGASPSELAAESGLPERQVAALLGLLERDGLLKRVRRPGARTSAYPFAEPLLRMWLQMRSSPEGERRVACIVEFFRAWYARAEGEYRRAIVGHLEHVAHLHTAGWGEAVQEALASLRYFAEASPSAAASKEALDRLFGLPEEVLESREGLDAVLSNVDQILSREPDDPDTLHNRGVTLHHLGRYEEALADYTQALVLRPDDPDTLHNRGVTLHDLGRYEEALADYTRALADYGRSLTVRPTHAGTFYDRGLLLWALGRYEAALADYQRAVELPFDESFVLDDASEAQGFAYLATAAAGRQELDVARDALTGLRNALRKASPSMRAEALLGALRIIFSRGHLELGRVALDNFGEAEVDAMLLEPYRQALAYLGGGRDPYFLQALNPDMRRAAELIVEEFGREAG